MNTVLFDLDGTLLPMDYAEFMETYLKALGSRLTKAGYDAKKIIDGMWAGVDAMYANDGYITNEECFWKALELYLCPGQRKMAPRERFKIEKTFLKFYATDFSVTRFNTRPTPRAKECVDMLNEKGYQVVVATNPVFPAVAILERLSWAGIREEDYAYVTTYENSCFTKPNLSYYRRLLQTLDKDPEDCIMVGNDVHEDMCAFKLGIDVFLINECMLNPQHEDIMDYKQGNWEQFKQFVTDLPVVG